MKVSLPPKTKLGWWSLGLIIAMPILFSIGSSFTHSLYQSVSSGRTIPQDIIKRPALALTMLSGMVTGVSAFISGLIAIIKEKERALLVYLSTLIGFLLILFLLAEVIFPH
jgi:hypothetical protein